MISTTCLFKNNTIGVSKSRLADNIEKRLIIIRGGNSHANACVGGADNGSNERLCCPSG